jgi:hypothetical protein
MQKHLYSFLDGAIIDGNTFRFIAVEDDRARENVPHGLVLTCRDGKWLGAEIGERLISCTRTGVSSYSFIAIAESGRELIIGDGGVRQELVATGPHSPTANGPLTAVKCWNNDIIFSVGTARQVYRKASVDSWERCDQSCKSKNKWERASSSFLDIDGYSLDEVYAVGWDGEIWMFDGASWKRMNSPVKLALHSVCCAPDGTVYACGQSGALLRGRRSDWTVMGRCGPDEGLRSICCHEGRIYVSSTNIIYVLNGDTLAPCADAPIGSTGKLRSANGVLMSVGLKDVALFHSGGWRTLV